MKTVNINDLIIEYQKKALTLPGWELHTHGQASVIVTPTQVPQLQICINPTCSEDLDFAASIFQDKTFAAIYDAPFRFPSTLEETFHCTLKQMYLDLSTSRKYSEQPEIERIQNLEELKAWAQLYNMATEFDIESSVQYLAPFIDNPKNEIYLATHKGIPVGTGHVYIGDTGTAQITSIAVIEQFRRKGIGKRIMHHCLARSQALGAHLAALHASQMGAYLYGSEGFHTSHEEHFSFFKRLPEANNETI